MPATPAAPVRRFWSEARRRPARLAPALLPPALRVVVVICWAAAAIMLGLAFVPGVFARTEHSLYGGEMVFGYSPIWPLLLGIALGSGAAATGLVYSATQLGAPRYSKALAWCAAVGVPAIPVLLLAADRSWMALATAVAWLTSTVILIVTVHVRHRPPAQWVGVLLTAAVTVPWVPAAVANIRLGSALGGPDDEVVGLLIDDLSAATYVPLLAIAFVAAMTAAGVALAAHGRAATVTGLTTSRRGWRAAAVTCGIAVVVIALEVSGFAGISSGFIDQFWSLDDPWAWPHAVAVAAAVAVVAQRSADAPLSSRGGVGATIAVGVGVMCVPITVALVLVVNLVANAVGGPEQGLVMPPAGLELVILWAALAALLPMALLRRLRGTVGQAVARVSLFYLVPVYVGITADQVGATVPAVFWASPAQVVIALVVICCVATLSGVLGRAVLAPEVVIRLVAIPLLIITLTSWVPSAIAVPLTPIIAAGAALFTLLWAMPPPAPERDEHSAVVLTASAQLLLVAACAAFVVWLPDVSPDDPTLAVLLLSIPLSALLCARVTAADDDGTRGPDDRLLRARPGVAGP